MATITLRTTKGSPLTNAEIDGNFTNLNNAKLETNGSGANLTALNASNVSSGILAVARGGTGQTSYVNGELLIGNTTGNTLTKATLTAGTNIGITNGTGTITIATSATPSFTTVTTSGAGTIGAALAVNGSSITTTGTGTATLFNTNALGLNLGGAATAISIGATTGTLTVNNTTLAAKAITASTTLGVTGNTTVGGTLGVTGAATLSSTLAVTGNTTITGDLAVNGSDITTSGSGTATVFNTNALTLNIGGAATAVNIGAGTGTLTVNNTTLAAKAITASSTLGVTGAATLSSSLGVSGNTTVGGTLGVTGNTTLSTVTVSGVITQGTAPQPVPTGTAPLFSARAWGVLDGTVRTDVTGTYSQSNGAGVAGTIVTVTTAAAHGLEVGDVFFSDITTGTGVDGWYTVTGVTSTTIFTYTGGTSLLTSGNITLPRCNISAGGNIKSFVSTNNVANATAGGGGYWVSFTTNMASANYATMGTSRFADSVSGTNTLVFVTYGHTIHGFYIGPCDNNADNLYKSQYISFAIFA